MVGVKIASDDDNMARAEIQKATLEAKALSIKNGLIDLGPVSSGDKILLQIKLTESGRKSLEVKAYAEH